MGLNRKIKGGGGILSRKLKTVALYCLTFKIFEKDAEERKGWVEIGKLSRGEFSLAN